MNTDIQNYMGALSQVNFSRELINERVQTQLQKNEALMPFSELALGESGKIALEKGVEFAKEAGVNAVKNFARGKMQEAGIDNDTINTILEGDLTNLSKVSSLINVAKQKALDVAKTKMQEAGVDDDTISSILKGDFNQAVKAKVDEAISKAKEIKSKVSDSIDNVSDDLKQSISSSQGIEDDLKAQAMQEYNKFRIDNGEMPTLMENDGFMSGLGNRFMNAITKQPPPEPQDIELVDMASLPPKAPVVSTPAVATDATVDTGGDIAGGIADVAVDAGLGEILGPIGLIGGLIGGIVGIIEGEKKPQVPQGILNPSEQFL
jgi:hypothetical protein